MNETKNIILMAALKLFLTSSYKDVTMKAILEASGQAKGTFYYHFKDKESVFKEVAEYMISNYMFVNFKRLPVDSVAEFIKAFLRAKSRMAQRLTLLGERPNIVLFINDARRRLPELVKLLIKQDEEEREAWLTVFAKGKASGEIRTDITDEHIADLFIHTYKGVASRELRRSEGDMMAHVAQDWENLYNLIKRP